MSQYEPNQSRAIMHFRRALSRGHVQDILARLTGRSNDLLAYDDVRHKLHGMADFLPIKEHTRRCYAAPNVS